MGVAIRLIFDGAHELGEGPLWHPECERLFWFDINAGALHACDSTGRHHQQWFFDEPVSAGTWIDEVSLLIASASGLLRFDIGRGSAEKIANLEARVATNRANDGRSDRHGAFWIGTMGRRGKEQPEEGALYRFRRGHLERMRDRLTIPNATAFSPDGRLMYFSDSAKGLLWRWQLNHGGDPIGEPEPFVDLSSLGAAPDGAVCDAHGFLWNAEWGGSRLVRYAPDGSVDRTVATPVSRPTCPAFGGSDFRTLFFTSAHEGMTSAERLAEPHVGGVFAFEVDIPGLPETPYRP